MNEACPEERTRSSLLLDSSVAVLAAALLCFGLLGCEEPPSDDDDSAVSDDDDSSDDPPFDDLTPSWWIDARLTRSVSPTGDGIGTFYLFFFEEDPGPQGDTWPDYVLALSADLSAENTVIPFGFGGVELPSVVHMVALLDDDMSSIPPDVNPNSGDLMTFDFQAGSTLVVDLSQLRESGQPLEVDLNLIF